MKRLTSILAISVITVMTASAARADIASVSYVNDKADAITAAAEQKANKVTDKTNFSADATSTEKYPSMAVANEMAKQAASLVGADISDLESKVDDMDTAYKAADTTLQGNIDKKQNLLNSGTGGNVTVSGTGNVVTGITADGKGNVTITKEATVATSDAVNALTNRVTTIEGSDAYKSGINSTKVASYDTHIKNGDIHVTAEQKTTWNNKQAALDTNQMAAVNSGVTKDLVTQITTNKNDITDKITAPGTANADITSDGTYTLTMKVVDNVKTYAWEKIGR